MKIKSFIVVLFGILAIISPFDVQANSIGFNENGDRVYEGDLPQVCSIGYYRWNWMWGLWNGCTAVTGNNKNNCKEVGWADMSFCNVTSDQAPAQPAAQSAQPAQEVPDQQSPESKTDCALAMELGDREYCSTRYPNTFGICSGTVKPGTYTDGCDTFLKYNCERKEEEGNKTYCAVQHGSGSVCDPSRTVSSDGCTPADPKEAESCVATDNPQDPDTIKIEIRNFRFAGTNFILEEDLGVSGRPLGNIFVPESGNTTIILQRSAFGGYDAGTTHRFDVSELSGKFKCATNLYTVPASQPAAPTLALCEQALNSKDFCVGRHKSGSECKPENNDFNDGCSDPDSTSNQPTQPPFIDVTDPQPPAAPAGNQQPPAPGTGSRIPVFGTTEEEPQQGEIPAGPEATPKPTVTDIKINGENVLITNPTLKLNLLALCQQRNPNCTNPDGQSVGLEIFYSNGQRTLTTLTFKLTATSNACSQCGGKNQACCRAEQKCILTGDLNPGSKCQSGLFCSSGSNPTCVDRAGSSADGPNGQKAVCCEDRNADYCINNVDNVPDWVPQSLKDQCSDQGIRITGSGSSTGSATGGSGSGQCDRDRSINCGLSGENCCDPGKLCEPGGSGGKGSKCKDGISCQDNGKCGGGDNKTELNKPCVVDADCKSNNCPSNPNSKHYHICTT